LFGVDFIYGRQGCRFPTGEIKSLIFAPTMPSQSMEQYPPNLQMPTYRQIGKPLKIHDLSAKNPETTGNKPAIFSDGA
jgi:hypothetical protein